MDGKRLTLVMDMYFYRLPTGYITPPTTKIGTKPAPVMAAFSSKGPNTISPDILKVLLMKTVPHFCSQGVDFFCVDY